MKRHLLFLILVVVMLGSSCAKTFFIPENIDFGFLDVRSFMDQGVLITPSSDVNQTYSPIGKLTATHTPEISSQKNMEEPKQGPIGDFYGANGGGRNTMVYSMKEVDIYKSIQAMVDRTISEGGNAILDFNYQFLKKEVLIKGKPIEVDYLIISGFAVKLGE